MPIASRAPSTTGVYHVTQRATAGLVLFLDDADRRAFLVFLGRVARRYEWQVLDYCLLTNHFHLVVRTVEPTLSRGMQYLNARHASRFNWRHGRYGHLVQASFRSTPIESEEHLAACHRYIALNPVNAGLCDDPARWCWSAYGGVSDLAPRPDRARRAIVSQALEELRIARTRLGLGAQDQAGAATNSSGASGRARARR